MKIFLQSFPFVFLFILKFSNGAPPPINPNQTKIDDPSKQQIVGAVPVNVNSILSPEEVYNKIYGKNPAEKEKSPEFSQKRLKELGEIKELVAEYKALFESKKERNGKSMGMNEEEMKKLKLQKEEKAKSKAAKDEENDRHGRKGWDEVNKDLNGYLIDGDIFPSVSLLKSRLNQLRDQQQGKSKRQAIQMNIIKWTSPIAYSIDPSYTPEVRDRFLKAIEIWTQNSCLKFVENPSATPLMQFVNNEYCHTLYGSPDASEGGVRGVYLGQANCVNLNQIVHEIGHALGAIHTQQRTDRDTFVTVHYQNAMPDYAYTYDIITDSDPMAVPYEIGSVMHYEANAYARDRSIPIMEPVDPLYRHVINGQSRGIAFTDILLINKFYQCQDVCDQQGTQIQCQNGGISNPNDCSQCICPAGFGGAQCQTNSPPVYLPWMSQGTLTNCGGVLTAMSTRQTLHASINVPAFPQGTGENPVDHYASCHWHIRANDQGRRVGIKIVSISEDKCSDLCYYGNLDLKMKADARIMGYRFCCQSDLASDGTFELVSESGLAVASIYSNNLLMEATLEYWEVKKQKKMRKKLVVKIILTKLDFFFKIFV